jgi:hypothetical protein
MPQAHNVLAVKQFLADKCIPVLEHPPPQFTGFSPLWLLSVPQTENWVERNSFSVCRWDEIKNGWPPEQALSWWPTALLWTIENSYATVDRRGESKLKGIEINLQNSENKPDFPNQSRYFIPTPRIFRSTNVLILPK